MLRSDKHPCLPALARQQAGMSILVIDDDPEVRSSVGMFLQARGAYGLRGFGRVRGYEGASEGGC